MEIIKGANFNIDRPSAVTIGKFDGIHLGHRKLITDTVAYGVSGLVPVLFTFDISPLNFFGAGQKLIYTNSEKEMILSAFPLDYIVEYPFSEATSRMEAESFFADVIVERLNAKALIVGEDFRFGYNRRGDVSLLSDICKRCGIKLDVIKKEYMDGHEIGSTLIRERIAGAGLEDAERMLGGPFFVSGQVIRGRQLGRTLDMPTINMVADDCKILPPNGVYTSLVVYKQKEYAGVTNIGRKPTISGDECLGIETHIMDFDSNLYGENVVVKLLHFQRPEMKFDDLMQLRKQMHKDKNDAIKYIRRY